ncbi:hypothetical protein [Pseudoalteromonas neustonica]|nr:hypothetical protein [Pseudoalteromonas neustonica]
MKTTVTFGHPPCGAGAQHLESPSYLEFFEGGDFDSQTPGQTT